MSISNTALAAQLASVATGWETFLAGQFAWLTSEVPTVTLTDPTTGTSVIVKTPWQLQQDYENLGDQATIDLAALATLIADAEATFAAIETASAASALSASGSATAAAASASTAAGAVTAVEDAADDAAASAAAAATSATAAAGSATAAAGSATAAAASASDAGAAATAAAAAQAAAEAVDTVIFPIEIPVGSGSVNAAINSSYNGTPFFHSKNGSTLVLVFSGATWAGDFTAVVRGTGHAITVRNDAGHIVNASGTQVAATGVGYALPANRIHSFTYIRGQLHITTSIAIPATVP